jgi:hypothetical protein
MASPSGHPSTAERVSASEGTDRPPARPGLGPDRLWFASTLALYLGTAAVLIFVNHQIVGDALSRVGSATYMVFSRDPHLGAIGFVWSPLPTFLMVPFVLLEGFWRPFVADGFAACVVSSIAMASAVVVLRRTLRDWGVPLVAAVVLTGLFAIQPMIVQYGANGDSEALFVLTILVLIRALGSWARTSSDSSLVVAAIALAAGYGVRYDAGAVAIAVTAFVTAWTAMHATGTWRARALAGVADAAIVAMPFTAAFVLWALASWIIVGSPFEQFTSLYGTTSQLQAGATGVGSDRLAIVTGQLVGLEPLALPLILVAALLAVYRRSMHLATAVIVCGAVLVFAAVTWLTGKASGWLRYEIEIVPLATFAAAAIAADVAPALRGILGGASRRPGPIPALGRAGQLAAILAAIVVAVGALVPGIPSTLRTMTDPVVGREDHYGGFEEGRYVAARHIADDLDARGLPDGSVLIDTFLGFPIVLDSVHQKQFVVTADRDFQQVLADPGSFEVGYILVPAGGGLGTLDAVERKWPGMYSSGGGIATLVEDYSGADTGGFNWRLYRIGT